MAYAKQLVNDKDEQIRQLRKALCILDEMSYKVSETTYQVQFSAKMKSEIENVLRLSNTQ